MHHLDALTEDAFAENPDRAWQCFLEEIRHTLAGRKPPRYACIAR